MGSTSVASAPLRSASGEVLLSRRERREAEQRAREAALRAAGYPPEGRSGDTVVVGGITFSGPAPISPVLGTPVVPRPTPPPAAPRPAPAPVAPPSSPFPAVPVPADLRSRAERAGRPEPAATPVAEAPRKRRAWLPRVAVLGTLAAATIAAPLTGVATGRGGHSPFALDQSRSGPSTLDVVAGPVRVPPVSPGIAAVTVVERAPLAVSRSADRDPLPGCDGQAAVSSANGKLGDAELCELPFSPGSKLQPRAAVALTALNDAFRAQFGVDIALVDSYRSLNEQYAVKRSRGYLAATPGTSMHGYGLAIDLADSVTGSSAAYKWLRENGAAYGWENPPWARRGGSGKYEPWHFEFRPGVEQVSTWH